MFYTILCYSLLFYLSGKGVIVSRQGAAYFCVYMSLVVSLCVRVGELYPPFLFALAVLVSMGSGRLCKVL